MNININADLNKALEVIGNGLSDTAAKSFKFVYPLAVKQVFIGSLAWFVIGIIFLVLTAVAVYQMVLLLKKEEKERDEEWLNFWLVLVFFFCVVGLFLVGLNYTGVFNPGYQAIQNIINMVKPK